MNSIANKISKIPLNLFKYQNTKTFESLHVIKCNNSQATAALKYATAATILYLMKTYRTLKNTVQGKKMQVVKEHPKDIVVLYQFPRSLNTPSLSPFALKLETWCRAANIKYQNKLGMKTSSKGLIPFIELNGYVVEDSQLCIEYLSKVFQKDLNSHLTDDQKAIARATLKLCEDSLRWCLILHRFWYSKSSRKDIGLPLLGYWLFSYKAYRNAYYAGYGRFSKEEIYDVGKKDLLALNTLVGDKKYLFSDSKPCDVDFAIFGICAQIKFNDQGPFNHYFNTECHNLKRHTENIMQAYWSDWNENILASKMIKKNSIFKILGL